jgi:hypothetical protein
LFVLFASLLGFCSLNPVAAYVAWDCILKSNGRVQSVVTTVFRVAFTNALRDIYTSNAAIPAALGNYVRYALPQPAGIFRITGDNYWITQGSGAYVASLCKQFYDLGPPTIGTQNYIARIAEYAEDIAQIFNYGVEGSYEPTNDNVMTRYFNAQNGLRRRNADKLIGTTPWNATAHLQRLESYKNWKGVPGAYPSVTELDELEKDIDFSFMLELDGVPDANGTSSAVDKRAPAYTCWYMTRSLIIGALRSGWIQSTKWDVGCSSQGAPN